MQLHNKALDLDSMAQEFKLTRSQKSVLSYNFPPLQPLATYAKNQTKFLKVVPKLHVRDVPVFDDEGQAVGTEPLVLKNVTVWCDHTGEIKYYFDEEEAQRWVDYIQEKGRHVKAKWRGQNLELVHWQLWEIREFFGWRRIGTALRRYKWWFSYKPRKNGKTLIFSIVALGFLMIDGEKAPELYNIGSAKDQSDTLFQMSLEQAGFEEGAHFADPELIELLRPSKNLIECPFNAGTFRTMPYNPGAFHGKNPSLVIVEEYHAHKSDDMKDVGSTGQGVRDQPAVIIDTTAGEDVETPCYEELLMARDIRDGVLVMPNYLPVIFEADENDPWDSLETAQKANPMYGISLPPEFFLDEIAMAKAKPLKKRKYIQLQLNRFVQDEKAAFDYDIWVKGKRVFDFRDFRKHTIYSGIDLGATDDLTAKVDICAPDGMEGLWYVHGHFWCPEKAIIANGQRGNYELWSEQKYLIKTPGNATDYGKVFNQIEQYTKFFSYGLINVDRANATWFATKLMEDLGLNVEFFGQGTFSMTEPIKHLLVLYAAERLIHNNPVLDWMCKNTILKGNDRACKFEKKSASRKIDGMVALAMAIAATLKGLNAPADDSGDIDVF